MEQVCGYVKNKVSDDMGVFHILMDKCQSILVDFDKKKKQASSNIR